MTVIAKETDLCHSKTPQNVDLLPAHRRAVARHKFVAVAEELGLSKDVADLFRANPLAAERAFRDRLFGVARSVLKPAFEDLDDHGPSLTVDDEIVSSGGCHVRRGDDDVRTG